MRAFKYCSYISLVLLSAIVAFAADGECRLLYAGNLARGDSAQQTEVRTQLLALQEKCHKEDVPSFTVLPGNLLDGGDGAAARNDVALHEISLLHPDVWALGTNEVTFCAQLLRTKMAHSGHRWLSLNARLRSLPVCSSRIMRAGALRVGITALTLSPGQLPDAALRARVEREVQRLRAHHCDLVILLGAFVETQAPMLAALFSGVDIVLGGPGESTPQAYGATVLAPTAQDLPYYGEVELAVRDNHLVSWRGGVMAVVNDKK